MRGEVLRAAHHGEEQFPDSLLRNRHRIEIHVIVADVAADTDDVALVADHVHQFVAAEHSAVHGVLFILFFPRLHRDRDEAVAVELEAHEGVGDALVCAERLDDVPGAPELPEVVDRVVVGGSRDGAGEPVEVAHVAHGDEIAGHRHDGQHCLVRGPVAVVAGLAHRTEQRVGTGKQYQQKRENAQELLHCLMVAGPPSGRTLLHWPHARVLGAQIRAGLLLH